MSKVALIFEQDYRQPGFLDEVETAFPATPRVMIYNPPIGEFVDHYPAPGTTANHIDYFQPERSSFYVIVINGKNERSFYIELSRIVSVLNQAGCGYEINSSTVKQCS